METLYKIKPLRWKRINNSKSYKEWKAVLPVGYALISQEIFLASCSINLFIHKGQNVKPTKHKWYPKLGTSRWCESVEAAKKKAHGVYLGLMLPFLEREKHNATDVHDQAIEVGTKVGQSNS